MKRPGLPGRFCLQGPARGLVTGAFRRRIASNHEEKATSAVESLPYIAFPIARHERGILHLAITRRQLLQGSAIAAATPALLNAAGIAPIPTAQAQSAADPAWRHALSLFGDIKYPADFKRFDYVNPDAPKGGVARLISIGTFDNFNIAVAGIKGNIAAAATQVYETLMWKSQDEVVTE